MLPSNCCFLSSRPLIAFPVFANVALLLTLVQPIYLIAPLQFEVGKDQLRYRAGASKGHKWLIIDLSGGTVCKAVNLKSNEFEVVDKNDRTWNLRAETSEDAREWVDVIATRTGAEVAANELADASAEIE